MKILLSAYACEPHRGSEPGVGWNMAAALAKHHEVWVLTTNVHRPEIEAELARQAYPNLHFIFVDPIGWVYNWYRKRLFGHWDIHIHYYLWQIAAYFKAKALYPQLGFEIIHHVTYVKYQSPSFLSLLPVPFVWGPVGGAEAAPAPFWQDFSLKNRIYELVRGAVRTIGEWDPFVRLTVRHSQLIWATTQDTADRIQQLGGQRVQVLSESGLQPEEVADLSQFPLPPTAPFRLISMGRLLHWKGFHLGLRAFAAANLPDAEYWILGIGPEEAQLKALAEKLNIAHQVKFWGRLPREEGLQKLAQSHVLVHPSLHDSGGWVCIEAMATGRPVICLDLGGPGVQVTAETGIKIPAHHPEQAVQEIAAAMRQLAQQPDLVRQFGEAGRLRARETFSWDSRTAFLDRAYRQLHDRTSLPMAPDLAPLD